VAHLRLRVQRTQRNTWKAVRMLFLSACFLLLTGVRVASAQCYTFSSGSAASLTVNITNLPAPSISSGIYSYSLDSGFTSSITVGQTTYTPSAYPSLILTVSSDSAIDFSAFDLTVGFISTDNSDVAASISVGWNGIVFPNGTLPATLPPIPGSFDPYMVMDVNGAQTSYTPDSVSGCSSSTLPPPPSFDSSGVVNGASFASGGIVPGEIATIFGTNLTVASGVNLTLGLPLVTSFLKGSVMVDGNPAPLFAIDSVNGEEQINFQVPWEVDGESTANLAVTLGDVTSSTIAVPVLAAQPGIFSYSSGGATFAVTLHANYQLADSAHPVTTGETVLIYCTGLGDVNSTPGDGVAATTGQTTVAIPTVTIGGVNAPVSFSGLAPDFVGLNQVNVQIPGGLVSGNQPVIISSGGVSSASVLLPVE